MNRKISIFTTLMAIVITNTALCSMYQVVKTLTVYGLPLAGVNVAWQNYCGQYDTVEGRPAPEKTKIWAENIMKKCKITPVLLLSHSKIAETLQWAAVNDRIIVTNADDITTLETILQKEPHCRNAEEENLLALQTMILKHELGHIQNRDIQKFIMVTSVAIPTAIQCTTSTIAYGCNKLFKIQPPKTNVHTVVRCGLLIIALVLKERIGTIFSIVYSQQIEANADMFACQNAGSQEELEQFKAFWERKEEKILALPLFDGIKDYPTVKNVYFREIGNTHPYPGDRAAMTNWYLEKWRTEHQKG